MITWGKVIKNMEKRCLLAVKEIPFTKRSNTNIKKALGRTNNSKRQLNLPIIQQLEIQEKHVEEKKKEIWNNITTNRNVWKSSQIHRNAKANTMFNSRNQTAKSM